MTALCCRCNFGRGNLRGAGWVGGDGLSYWFRTTLCTPCKYATWLWHSKLDVGGGVVKISPALAFDSKSVLMSDIWGSIFQKTKIIFQKNQKGYKHNAVTL